MKTRALVLLSLLCVLPVFAHAGNLTLAYTPPATCADGTSPTTMCPTTGYEILGAVSVTAASTTLETVAPTVTSRTWQNLTPGTYCRSVKTISNAQKSDESQKACADVPSLPPKAPQGITVTVNVTVSSGP